MHAVLLGLCIQHAVLNIVQTSCLPLHRCFRVCSPLTKRFLVPLVTLFLSSPPLFVPSPFSFATIPFPTCRDTFASLGSLQFSLCSLQEARSLSLSLPAPSHRLSIVFCSFGFLSYIGSTNAIQNTSSHFILLSDMCPPLAPLYLCVYRLACVCVCPSSCVCVCLSSCVCVCVYPQ